MSLESKVEAQVWTVTSGEPRSAIDALAAEEPLEIRLVARGKKRPVPLLSASPPEPDSHRRTVALTMRTPGDEFELAAGFLYGEGIVKSRSDILTIQKPSDGTAKDGREQNVVEVELSADRLPDLKALERHFYTTSACGVCGKTSLEALHLQASPLHGTRPIVDSELLSTLPEKLRGSQGLFAVTGGLHAAALFTAEGELLAAREDVGRHNALDKLIGWAFFKGLLPLEGHIVLVSGRASFELLQKSLMARVPILCSVSAPSSLAVSLARDFGLTLVGFLRDRRFNVYAGLDRVRLRPAVPAPLGPDRRT